MSTDSSLRQLRWPALPAVDLLEECHWLVTLGDRNPNHARKPGPAEDAARHKLDLLNEMQTKELQNLSKQKSPYRQPLRRPKPPAPSPGSPAQRAAKSILKLNEGLLHVDNTKWSSDIQDDVALPPQQQQNVHQPINGSSVCSPSKSGDSFVTTQSLRSPSPKRAKTPIRSPKKKKRPPTREERELAKKQDRLAVWLDANPTSIVQTGRNGDVPIDAIPPYSIEVESRIESAMQCRIPLELGMRLWDDPVHSLLAAEMTSESVFGGATPTRALAFQAPEPTSPPCLSQCVEVSPPKQPLSSNHKSQSGSIANFLEAEQLSAEENASILDSPAPEPQLSVHAQKVFGTAHRQVADGAVADALATLEAGIRQSLSTSQAHLDASNGSLGAGFNYSVLAHKSATKLQLYYRIRHRRRINRLMLLQRQWRWWHARRRMLSSVQFANNQAIVIQRRYKSWYIYITQVRNAVRIQRCFRVFKTQKFLSRFRQVCRLLMVRQARRRQVKTRMRVIGKIIFLFRRRRRRIALIQGLWRRRCAQAQLATLLAHVKSVEVGRRAREDEFVGAKLVQARLHFREFLKNTKRGCELVRWQAEKPWLRFRRLRHDTTEWNELPLVEKIEGVARILPGREFRGLQERALCQMLVGKNKQLLPLPKVLKVSTKELGFLVNSSMDSDVSKLHESVGCCRWTGTREKMKHIQTKLSRRAATLWWTLVTYPLEYCTARIWPIRKRRRDHARQQLEDDFARVLIGFLRVWFRRFDSKTNTPPYACEWCSEPFATSREFFAHDKCAGARTRAEAEWTALSSDLQFVRRKKWRFFKHPHDDPVRTNNYAFDLEAASVRRLRHSHSNRKALRPLVALLEVCTGDSPNAVIPLDLAAFVLQYLDNGKTSHSLMQTAEHQLIRWKTLIGLMEVETSMQSPRDSGFESRWIRKDELRSRLIVGMEWRSVLSRWRRNLTRRVSKYQALNSPRVGSCNQIATKWKELQVRTRQVVSGRGAKTAQDMPTSQSATGSHVLVVAT